MSLAHLGAEAYRLQLLTQLECELQGLGFARVAGVDEAGRGSLAGPVVAAAVIPDPRRVVAGVDDSKRLTPASREGLAARIRDGALAVSIVVKSAAFIDRVNILRATRQAMTEALTSLEPDPEAAVVDAVKLESLPYPVLSVVRGDAVSYAVACASILAKDLRDRLMCELHEAFPMYGFARNKGYGAPEHLKALTTFGPCSDHRLTFASVLPSGGCS